MRTTIVFGQLGINEYSYPMMAVKNCKYILCKRGIFESNNVRPPSINPNTQAYKEMDSFIKQLKLSNEK